MLICFISVVCSGWGGMEDSADSDQVCLGNMLGSVSLGPHDQELLDEQGSSPASSMDNPSEVASATIDQDFATERSKQVRLRLQSRWAAATGILRDTSCGDARCWRS